MSDTEEKWTPLKEGDMVFSSVEDGRFVAYPTNRGLFGGKVRFRDGKWMAQELPLMILSPDLIQHYRQEKKYVLGADVMKVTPRAMP